MFEQFIRRGRGAKACHTHEAILAAQEDIPALPHGRFDADARPLAKHVLAIAFGLHREEFETRRGNDARLDPLFFQRLARFERQRNLGA